jgi:preprotein translocase subunit SecG
MVTFLTVLYVVVCIFLITVVLLQAGRGGGMGAAFGGSSQTVFGGAGAGNFLTRLTVVMAALFMLLSATLAYMSSSSDKALDAASEKAKLRDEARDVGTTGSGAAASEAEEPAVSTPEAAEAAAEGVEPQEVVVGSEAEAAQEPGAGAQEPEAEPAGEAEGARAIELPAEGEE